MTTEPENPFLGRTHYRFRPTNRMRKYKFLDQKGLQEIQAQWDTAVAIHKAPIVHVLHAPVERDDSSEELISKAAENRARVKFLSTRGTTMRDWLEQRDSILSNQ